MTIAIEVERWLPRPGAAAAGRNVALSIGEEGISASPGSGGGGRLAMPAPIDAHDHGYGIRTLDFGWPDDALEPWIAGMRLRPPTDPYLEALVAFGRVALSGCAATMHCHNSLNAGRLVEEAGKVVRAACDCGIRLAFSCPLLDASPWVYGGPEALRAGIGADEWEWLAPLLPRYAPIAEQLSAVEELIVAAQRQADGLRPKLENVRSLISRLGPAPDGKDVPPESAAIAEQRARLNTVAAEIDGAIKQAALVETRARLLSGRIQTHRQEIFTRDLLRRSRSPLTLLPSKRSIAVSSTCSSGTSRSMTPMR